jgi:hypothetical protein
MKNAIIWIMCMIVVAAAALIIADKVQDLVDGRSRNQPIVPVHPGGADSATADRLARIEKAIVSLRRMLETPQPNGNESRMLDEPLPSQSSLGERLQFIESELSELRRQANRDLMQIYTRLRRRLDELEGKLLKEGAPDSRATAEDLKKQGVDWDPAKNLITMEAAFVHPTRVLEFVAVSEGGSGHESLLLLNARPSALKRALEMMHVAEAPDPRYDPAKIPKECTVYLYVSWPGRATPIRVEKCLRNVTTGNELEPTPFIFTASHPFVDPRTWDEYLAADLHKNTIALTWNYAAEGVLACPALGAEDEHAWTIAVDVVPEPPSPATLYVSKDPVPEWEK